jgi:hypothetical protein
MIAMSTPRTILLAGLMAIASAGPALALTCDPKFDKDRNGRVDKGGELDLCTLHATSEVHRKHDKNLNGRIDPKEAAGIDMGARETDAFITTRGDAMDALGDAAGLTPVKTPGAPAKVEEPVTVESDWLLRKAYQPVTIIGKVDDKAPGAEASFVYDFANDVSIASASGVVEAYRRWTLNPSGLPDGAEIIPPFTITNAAIHGGAEFNRKINSADPSKDIDSLILRGGGEIAIQGPGKEFNLARFNIFDATSFAFETHLIGAEAEFEPVYEDLAIGKFQPLGPLPVYVRWRPILHAEYQSVVDDGGLPALAAAQDYLFAGPVISGELTFGGALERLYFDATYWAMWDALGNADPFQYFTVGANWGLDAEGRVALTARYRDGNLPKTRQAVQDVTLGLTFRY